MNARINRFAAVTFALTGLALLLGAAHAAPLLQQGDRMVFLGDSITQQRIYTRYVMNYFALHYPDLRVTFRNAGVGGDTAVGAIKRLDNDVLDAGPDLVSICFGMNDAGYGEFKQDRWDEYVAAMTVLVAELKRRDIEVVLLTPGPVDPDRTEGSLDGRVYNGVLARYAEAVRKLAADSDLPVYDIHTFMLDVQTRAKADDPSFTMIPDAVHPSPPGQALMAYALLAALGCDQPASGLEIDARTKEPRADRCAVDHLRVSDNEITFARTDDALPAYLDPEVSAILRYTPIITSLNRYPFTVKGLAPGSWRLTVDDAEVGIFTSQELAAGVDLARKPGPWQTLGEAVNDLVADQERLYLYRRQLAGIFRWVSSPPPEAEAEKLALMKKLDEVIAAREKAWRALAHERTWEWSLTLAP